jgi:hypothetical protein
MELDLEEFEVNTMLAEVATTIQPLVEKNGNSFAWGETDELGLSPCGQNQGAPSSF